MPNIMRHNGVILRHTNGQIARAKGCCCVVECCDCAPTNLKATFEQIAGNPCGDSALDGLVITDLDQNDDGPCPLEWKAETVGLDCGEIELEFKCDSSTQYILEDIATAFNDNAVGDSDGFALVSTQCDPFRVVFEGIANHGWGCCDTDNVNGPYTFRVTIEEDV